MGEQKESKHMLLECQDPDLNPGRLPSLTVAVLAEPLEMLDSTLPDPLDNLTFYLVSCEL